jgi:hypothetical protein
MKTSFKINMIIFYRSNITFTRFRKCLQRTDYFEPKLIFYEFLLHVQVSTILSFKLNKSVYERKNYLMN